MMKLINNFLNSITMYRLVLYGLAAISIVAIAFGFLDILAFSGFELVASLVVALTACYFFNIIFSKILSIPTNTESSAISAFILFLILAPSLEVSGLAAISVASLIAMASKFIMAPLRKHIFNPAAFGAFAIYVLNIGGAIWWVASFTMLPIVLLVSLLIVQKVRRFPMVLTFLATAVVSISYFNFKASPLISGLLLEAFTSWPIIFFGTIMLTEPLTTPPTKHLRLIYAALVGLLFGSQFHIGPLIPTPEFVLLLGNIFSYIVGFKTRLRLTLIEKIPTASNIYEFIFKSDRIFSFAPGQYLEWTLPHTNPDTRGIRRYFTIASSPNEKNIYVGVKFYEPSSSFKKQLASFEKGDTVFAGELAGDFTLPQDTTKKLVFIAGGIGITPFRSMVQYLLDINQKRDAILLYAVKHENEITYKDIFTRAEARGMLKPHYIISKLINENLIRENIIDWHERIFYISGPDPMVRTFKKMLSHMKVPRNHIITDYFPGYA